MNCKIIGVSFDTAAQNAKFKKADKFAFDLWSDTERELALFYGAAAKKTQSFADRVTVLLDEKGQWVLFYGTGATNWDPGGHPKAVLDDLKLLQTK